jgi:type I restriction enzyme S subunit
MVMSDIPNGRAIAKCFYVEENNKYTVNQRIAKLSATCADPKFIYYSLNRNSYYLRFDDGVKQTNLRKDEVLDCPIRVPPIHEQKRIADILTTWDKAISTAEQFLANSQQQKKALMQQLLSGKKRIEGGLSNKMTIRDGFSKKKLGMLPDDWKVEKIKKHLWYQEGPGVRNHQFTESGVKLFNGTNIQFNRVTLTSTTTHISEEEAFGPYKHFLVEAGDLLIACSGISVDRFDEKIAFIGEDQLPLCMNTSTMRFKTLDPEKVDINYFNYFMKSSLFKNQIRRQVTGSAQLNFGPSHVGVCYVVLPPINEQREIASILISADKETDLLKINLGYLRREKEALMQQLLTGKRRVKI